MRRRRALSVWPAFADLMTVLTIVGLFTAIGLFPSFASSEYQRSTIAALRDEIETLQSTIEEERKEFSERLAERNELILELEETLRMNRNMVKALHQAQLIIDRFSERSNLQFSEDQSLQFGDDLVEFEINSLEPLWSENGRERLRNFCRELSAQMNRLDPDLGIVKDILTVQVEGHTDSTTCSDDPNCNWRFSSGRAASFVTFMRDNKYCPGGEGWDLRSIGFADTRPFQSDGEYIPTRRIAVRVVPNYKSLITAISAGIDEEID